MTCNDCLHAHFIAFREQLKQWKQNKSKNSDDFDTLLKQIKQLQSGMETNLKKMNDYTNEVRQLKSNKNNAK